MSNMLSRHFDERAPSYNQGASWVTSPILEKLHKELFPKDAKTLLDLATGTGVLLHWFNGISEFQVGIDISFAMLNSARNIERKLIQADASLLPFPSKSFDIIICRQGIHYMDFQSALSEMKRIGRRYILISQIVCSSDEDAEWWSKIFSIKQPLRRNIFTHTSLVKSFGSIGYSLKESRDWEDDALLSRWFNYGHGDDKDFIRIRELFRSASASTVLENKIMKVADDFFFVNRWDVLLFENDEF